MEALIYDRTQSDITNKTSKGRYAYADLNRVEGACRELADLLTSYGYPVSITTKTDWGRSNMQYISEKERIRTNIVAIKQAYYSMPTTPELPTTLNKMDIQKANDIEKILHDIDVLIGEMEANWRYSGDVISGEGYFSD